MGKRKVNSKRSEKIDKLESYNLRDYKNDIDYLSKLRCGDSTRNWIEERMYELRASANRYERALAEFLMKKGVVFVHQAPFVFYWKKIYFADFYIPSKRVVIEVDGSYHDGLGQTEKDKERERDFKEAGIRTVRIPNAVVINKERLEMRLTEYI